MRWGIMMWVLMMHAFAYGQATLHVDHTEIRIGDQVKATLSVELESHETWVNPDNIWPDSMKGIEIASGPDQKEEVNNKYSLSWNLSFFDTGWVRIPALPVIVSGGVKMDTMYTRDIPIRVSAVELDSAGLRAIKDIHVTPFNAAYYKKYLPHVLGIILIIIGLYLWLRQRKHRANSYIPPPPPLQPHEWAFKALDDLIQRKLWQQGEVKEHYTQLTAILREYLERRFGIHAMEQTSDEIITQLRGQNLSHVLLADTEELLSIADMIKFAKADPGMDVHAVAIESVRAFVTGTIPINRQEEQSKSEDDAVVE